MSERREPSSMRLAFRFEGSGADKAGKGSAPRDQEALSPPSGDGIPRIAKLLALAHYMHAQVQTGKATSCSALANRLGITRARATQITNLLLLSPRIQEDIAFLSVESRRLVRESSMRRAVATPIWDQQKRFWRESLVARCPETSRAHETKPRSARRVHHQ